jgi:hypothetical protein
MAQYVSSFCPYCNAPLSLHQETGWNYYEDHFGDPQALCYRCFKPYKTGRNNWSSMDYSEKFVIFLRLSLSIVILSFLLSLGLLILSYLLNFIFPSLIDFIDSLEPTFFLYFMAISLPFAIYFDVRKLMALIKKFR